jgi:hypothetical protein
MLSGAYTLRGFPRPLFLSVRDCYADSMNHGPSTLDRLVEPMVRTFTPEVARSLIQLRADPELQARMDELAEKCNEGRLTPEEREEYETSIRFANYLAIIQRRRAGF